MPTAIDPSTLVVGQIISGIQGIIQQLSDLVDTTSGDIKSVVIQTQQSAEQLEADMAKRFKDDLGAAVKDLDTQRQHIALEAAASMASMQAAIDQAKAAADDTALAAMQDASITTYDALWDLPCRQRLPRAVYATPRSIRVWADANSPGEGPNKQKLSFIIRGNYVSAFGTPTVTIQGQQQIVTGTNRNELYIDLSADTVSSLLNLQQSEQMVIKTSLAKCDGNRIESDVNVMVKPAIKYQISGRIAPTVVIPYSGSKNYSYSRTGDCTSNFSDDQDWPADPGTTVTDCNVSITSANCGSGVSAVKPSGSACFVGAQIHGCGKDCFLGICNCKGRGWLRYNIGILFGGMRPQPLAAYDIPPVINGSQLSYVFPYAPGLPADRDTTQTTCDYYLRIAEQQGGATQIVELTNNTPTPAGYKVDFNNDDCSISLTVPTPLAQLNQVR